MRVFLYQNGHLLTLLSNFCQVAMVLYVFSTKKFLSVCKNFTEKNDMKPRDFLQEKTLKINIRMGYTSVFTTSVLKVSSKFKKDREDSFINFLHRNIPAL